MKKYILSIITVLAAFPLFGQGSTETLADTTEITVGKKTILIIEDSSSNHKDVHIVTIDEDGETEEVYDGKYDHGPKKVDVGAFALDLGANFLTQNNSFNLPSELNYLESTPIKSTHCGMHFLPTRISLYKSKVNLVTAVTLDNNRFAFQNNISLVPGTDTLTWFTDSVTFTKNKLISTYAQIPLLLNFQTNPGKDHKNFHFSIGGYAGLWLKSKTKQESEERGLVNIKDDYSLNNIRYGLMARIGYNNLELYTNYNLSGLFRDNQGPTVMPITFGISIIGLH